VRGDDEEEEEEHGRGRKGNNLGLGVSEIFFWGGGDSEVTLGSRGAAVEQHHSSLTRVAQVPDGAQLVISPIFNVELLGVAQVVQVVTWARINFSDQGDVVVCTTGWFLVEECEGVAAVGRWLCALCDPGVSRILFILR